MRYTIYCDESEHKGRFYGNFYGGAILATSDREAITGELEACKAGVGLKGEAKWTKIGPYNEAAYKQLVDKIFDLVEANRLKLRTMFTQNIDHVGHVEEYKDNNEFYLLYYQFIKHAFGLRFCNPLLSGDIHLAVMIDDAPDKSKTLDNFKQYLSSLSSFPVFFRNRIHLAKEDIAEIDSGRHSILQATDVVLGAMQFRLNDLYKEKPEGSRLRGKRTRAKERVYKQINARIRTIYPGFNIGVSTGQSDGPICRWTHPYRHWCFVPAQSVPDRSRGKRYEG